MTVRSSQRPVFDPVDPAFLEDPYPCYAQIRDAGPLVRLGPTQWVTGRHAQVTRLLRDPRLRNEWPEPFQRMRLGDGEVKDFLLRLMLYREGTDHTQLRRFLSAIMHATPAAELRSYVARVSDQQIRGALESGRLEVMDDLAFPVPLAAACELIGVPDEDRPMIKAWGIELIKAFAVVLSEPDRPLANTAITELRNYFRGSLRGRDPKLAAIAAALGGTAASGPLRHDELVDNVIFLLVSGFTTTVHLIATALAILLDHPGVIAQLRDDRSLLHGAVEELLRYDAPLQHISRLAVEIVDVDGQKIRPGRVVHLLLGSANHDERQFASPERLDIRREPNPHVSFGTGLHACLGAGLGRLELTTLLDRLLSQCRILEPGGTAVRRPMQVFRTYSRIPVAVAA
ncbi:MAG: cytochrome P450 [Streptosporangiaceae bacterium]|nr:cytochrome P450 [Streptosporangiaceae bacterium]